ncbi:hypothetical protein GAU_2247 [Gemmatimonas aurantiaca T-27]|uniref:Uncharacterized protein n=1 Tax=Gemmatimonas aurantiaca (strain DSM 14586 / JCM 11422 / NBRC 100505 / T-27) TaxID=379066 RepID=C1A9W2_GEMAT|nr:hypothetical protein GAU_2247 [Gemmatimonas aurantiaca T-27]
MAGVDAEGEAVTRRPALLCAGCGVVIEQRWGRQARCAACAKAHDRERRRLHMREYVRRRVEQALGDDGWRPQPWIHPIRVRAIDARTRDTRRTDTRG